MKILYIILCAILSVVLMTGCEREYSTSLPVEAQVRYGESPDYAVFSALLNYYFARESGFEAVVIDPTVVIDSTVGWIKNLTLKYLSEDLPGIKQETYDNFIQVNNASMVLLNIPDLHFTCHVLSGAYSNWKKIYPGASVLIILSKPGYDYSNTQALVYRSEYTASHSASGNLIFLQRDDAQSEWEYAGSLGLWITVDGGK